MVNVVPSLSTGNFREGFVLAMRSFVKMKPSRNGEIIMSLNDFGISCPICEFLTLQICHLMLFAKIKFARKFQNLQYSRLQASS